MSRSRRDCPEVNEEELDLIVRYVTETYLKRRSHETDSPSLPAALPAHLLFIQLPLGELQHLPTLVPRGGSRLPPEAGLMFLVLHTVGG